MTILPRPLLLQQVQDALKQFPVVLLLGPRQCGKTTLARQVQKRQEGAYFDLEDPETPLKPEIAKTVLKDLKGLIVIDEFQRQPELFQLLRVLADRKPLPAKFLILGSASLDIVRGVSESLAGRVAYIRMSGFSITEVGADQGKTLWLRGGFPDSFLSKNDKMSFVWRTHFTQSFLERDIPQLGIRIPAPTLRRFWTMVAHFHGQIWNAAAFARSLGTKEDTARRYLDILSGAYMIRQLPAWFENIGKRLVKAPKIFVRDPGILHVLLGLRDRMQLLSSPQMGFSWEGFVLEQILSLTEAERDAYYYKTHAGAELDLLLLKNGKRYGFEFKLADAPGSSKSMHTVSRDLKLDHLWVVYPGSRRYPLGKGFEVVPLLELPSLLEKHGLSPGQ